MAREFWDSGDWTDSFGWGLSVNERSIHEDLEYCLLSGRLLGDEIGVPNCHESSRFLFGFEHPWCYHI